MDAHVGHVNSKVAIADGRLIDSEGDLGPLASLTANLDRQFVMSALKTENKAELRQNRRGRE